MEDIFSFFSFLKNTCNILSHVIRYCKNFL